MPIEGAQFIMRWNHSVADFENLVLVTPPTENSNAVFSDDPQAVPHVFTTDKYGQIVVSNLEARHGWSYSLQEVNPAPGYMLDPSGQEASFPINPYNKSAFNQLVNTRMTPLPIEVYARKTLTNGTLQAGQFTFELVEKETGTLVATTQNDALGNVVFRNAWLTPQKDPITLIMREQVPQESDGVYYDEREYEIPVKFVFPGSSTRTRMQTRQSSPATTLGGAAIAAMYLGDLTFDFGNVANITDFTITKKWQGGSEPRPSITLQLQRDGQAYGPPAVLDGKISEEADGSGELSPWQYTWKNLPTARYSKGGAQHRYIYTVEEKAVAGYTTQYSQDGKTITNIFKPVRTPSPSYPSIEVPLQVRKVLQNSTLKEGQFTFELVDGAGKTTTASNRADGSVVFTPRTFSKVVSDYLYTIREVPGTDNAITYDGTIYTVKVTTTLKEGKLVASTTVLKNGQPFDGDMVFTNQSKIPPTGDSTPMLMLLLLVSSALMGAIALSKRRQANR